MPDYSRYKYIKVENIDRVAVVTLNRPDVLNAPNEEMHGELRYIWLDLAEDKDVRAIVLTGAGRGFCAGADVRRLDPEEWFGLGIGDEARRLREAQAIWENMLNVDQPMIAAVNGPAMGLGLTLALSCDIIIASEKAKMGDTHVRMGLVAGDGGAIIWPLMVGIHRAKELLMTGDIIDAREAERIGLVNRVVPEGELMDNAMTLARRLADGPTWAIRWTKVSMNKWLKLGTTMIQPESLALEWLTFKSQDHVEAGKAFLEKRQAKFRD